MADGEVREENSSLLGEDFGEQVSRRDRYYQSLDEFVFAPMRILWSDWRGRAGLLLLSIFVLAGTVGVMVVRLPKPNQAPRYVPPFQELAYPLGTDALGRDLLSMLVHSTPQMLEMVLAGAVFTTVVATIVGTFSGYARGMADTVLMSISDVLMTIPSLPLVMVVVIILQPEQPWLVGVLLSINAWASLARAIRSEVLTLRHASYVEASQTMGLSTRWILLMDLLPNLMSYVSIRFVTSARQIVFGSVGLYFLGILPFNALNWGVMMNMAYRTGGGLFQAETFYWILEPMIAIVLFSLGLIFLAQGLDRVFNPRIRVRHAKSLSSTDSKADGDSAASTEVS